jgi:hypothetical protein
MLLTAAFFAALLAAGSAEAATTLKVGQQVNGNLSVIGKNYVWTIKLEKGKDYAFEVITSSDGYAIWTVKNPAGKTIHISETGEDESYGFEFRAIASGTYKIIGRAVEADEANTFHSRGFRSDCRGTRTTKCYLNLGATQNRYADYITDVDWVLLKGLTAGKQYTVTIADVGGQGWTSFDLVRAEGTVIAGGSPDFPAAITFIATGEALYARHRHDNDAGERVYSLTLQPAAQ